MNATGVVRSFFYIHGMRRLLCFMVGLGSWHFVASQDPLEDKAYFGVGAGLDHGGLGVRIDVRPWEHCGAFGGVGWALGGLGWNAGLHVPILTGRAFNPYITGMYGYNTVYVVKNRKTGTQVDRDIYYGPSFGGGVEIGSREGARLVKVGLLVPVRPDQVLVHHPSIKNELWPVLFTIGLHFRV